MIQTHAPRDQYGQLFGDTLCGVSLGRYVGVVTSVQQHTLNEDTRFIRVFAISKDVYLNWPETPEDYAKADNFDELIVAGTYIDLEVPVKIDGSLFDAVSLVGRESGATAIVIEK